MEHIGQIKRQGAALFLDGRQLADGDRLAVLVYDGLTQNARWVETQLEASEAGYNLSGLWGYLVEGLFAKVD